MAMHSPALVANSFAKKACFAYFELKVFQAIAVLMANVST
jgi:hypothetical protein